MHRSETTYLARNFGEIPGISGFHNTPGEMDEGQFLQRVFPVDVEFGGMGYFGYHPRSRMLELSPAKARSAGVCLLKDWLTCLDQAQPVFLEKTPSNFRRSRMLASLFPKSHFVHIFRHPVATALALKAFAPNAPGIKKRSIRRLVDHWTSCQMQAVADYEWLRERDVPVVALALEDLPPHSAPVAEAVGNWIGSTVLPESISVDLKAEVNDKYQKQLDELSDIERRFSPKAVEFMRHLGYEPHALTRAPGPTRWLE